MSSEISRRISRATRTTTLAEVPLLPHQLAVPAHQGIGRDNSFEFQKGFAAHRLRLPSKERSFGVPEPNALAAEPLLQETILGLKELDDDQLSAMDPTGHDRQQKRRHGTHAGSLAQSSSEYLDTTGAGIWYASLAA
jgi:hypothetical protein